MHIPNSWLSPFSRESRALGCVLFLGAALAACAAPTGPDDADDSSPVSSTESALLGAPIDQGHKFAVGVCGGPLSEGTSGTCTADKCSGTLVAPNVVLTAQHCIFDIRYAAQWCDSSFSRKHVTDAPMRLTTSDSTIVG